MRPAAVVPSNASLYRLRVHASSVLSKKAAELIIDRDCDHSSRSVGRVGKCYAYGAVVKVCAGCGQVSCP